MPDSSPGYTSLGVWRSSLFRFNNLAIWTTANANAIGLGGHLPPSLQPLKIVYRCGQPLMYGWIERCCDEGTYFWLNGEPFAYSNRAFLERTIQATKIMQKSMAQVVTWNDLPLFSVGPSILHYYLVEIECVSPVSSGSSFRINFPVGTTTATYMLLMVVEIRPLALRVTIMKLLSSLQALILKSAMMKACVARSWNITKWRTD
jgi:hypothetical protein